MGILVRDFYLLDEGALCPPKLNYKEDCSQLVLWITWIITHQPQLQDSFHGTSLSLFQHPHRSLFLGTIYQLCHVGVLNSILHAITSEGTAHQ